MEALFASAGNDTSGDSLEGAHRRYRQRIAESPSLFTYGNYAHFLGDFGKKKAAEENFQKAFDCVPDPETASQGIKDAYCLYLGFYAQLNESCGEYQLAKERYDTILLLNPTDPLAMGNLAVLLHRHLKQHDAAEAAYLLAIEAHPAHAGIIGKYANFLKHVRQNFDGAADLYQQAIEANPQHADCLGNYAVLLHGKTHLYAHSYRCRL